VIVFNNNGDPITMGGDPTGITIPGVMVGQTDGELFEATISGGDPIVATLDPSNLLLRDNRVAGFSSRGPNGGAPDIIKPDVAAPGVRILAAETPDGNDFQVQGELFQSIGGTSMASPHVAGLFALLKEAHPNWTPAMARSAIMTTARQNLKKTFGDTTADPFDIGAGHIVPSDSFDPGLAYDAGLFDYAAFSCGNNVSIFTPGSCDFLASLGFSFDGSDLNLPSIGIGGLAGSQTVTRTVTNVANNSGNKSFTVSVDAPPGIDVTVSPSTVKLKPGQSASYQVTLTANSAAVLDEWTFGSLTWSHGGEYSVRSPIAVQPIRFDAPAEAGGSGTSGSLSFDVGFGYEGDYAAGAHGLVPAGLNSGNVLDDPANDINVALATGVGVTFEFVNVTGDEFARFSMTDADTDGNDDLDLYVFGPDTAGFPFAGGSGNASSNEQVDLVSPTPGLYIVAVHGWATDGPDANYTLSSWSFGPDLGNMSVTAPAAAVLGTSTITVDWAGLAGGTTYLGGVSHNEGASRLGLTVISVDTN
jgi:hypothetical protein